MNPGPWREEWDAQRVRERVNHLQPRYGMHHYAVAARHDDTGELAAMTEVAVDPADPGWGHQVITAVTREHRGHRLGLLLKLAMMELLATAEPRLERLETMERREQQAHGRGQRRPRLRPLRRAFRLLAPRPSGQAGPGGLVAAGRLLGHCDHADDLGLGSAKVGADGRRRRAARSR